MIIDKNGCHQQNNIFSYY